MKPAPFAESNTQLVPEHGPNPRPVYDAYRAGEVICTRWRGSFMERVRFLVFGTVWLHAIGPAPRVAMGTRNPFRMTAREHVKRFLCVVFRRPYVRVLAAPTKPVRHERRAKRRSNIRMIVGGATAPKSPE